MLSTKLVSYICGLLFLAFHLQVQTVSAACCGSCSSAGTCPGGYTCRSNDYCCATQSCNIFCCACHGVCRTSLSQLRTNIGHSREMAELRDNEKCQTVADLADTNNDGVITFVEWAESQDLLEQTEPLSRWTKRWAAFDIEGKGYLTKAEALNRKA